MTDEIKLKSENAIAHMAMIQGVVTRLETNCFTLKALAMTLAVGIIAFIGSIKNPTIIYPLAGYLPIIVFWLMDAKYLRLGRLYRRLYEVVRTSEAGKAFTMDIKPYVSDEQSTFRIAVSWSVFPFYLSIFIAFSAIVLNVYCS